MNIQLNRWLMKRALIIGTVSIAVVAAVFTWRSAPSNSKALAGKFAFDVAQVTQGEIRRVVATTGTVKPRSTVQVGSELSGRVKEIVADFNSEVKAGDVLALIDPKTFEARSRQAKAELLAAEAAVSTAEASMRRAASNLRNAEAVNGRQQELGQKGIASRANVDGAERDLKVASADLDLAKGNLENALAVVAQKKAQLDQANLDLDRTIVRTPISGIVLHRAVDVGQTVAASLQAPELFRIAGDLTSVHVEAQVNEADVGAVKAGQLVRFHVDAYPGRSFEGRVEQVRLSPTLAESVVTYSVIINAENKSLALFPGMTAHVRLETGYKKDVTRIPLEAARFQPPKGSVDAKAEKAPDRSKDEAGAGDEEGSGSKARKSDPDAILNRWARRLKMDQDQIANAARLIKSPVSGSTRTDSVKKGNEGELARSDKRRIEEIIVSQLRPDQIAIYEAHRAQKEPVSTIWTLGADGVPQRKAVKLGIADAQYVEVIGLDLAPGTAVITRSRKVRVQ